jgi:hypothetical protein
MLISSNGVTLSPISPCTDWGRSYSLGLMTEDKTLTIAGIKTGLNPITANTLHAVSVNGGLLISGIVEGEEVSLYNSVGTLLYRAKATSVTLHVPLATHGVYFIIAGKRTLKARF